ncbi:MAG: hypothetical protein LBJ00_01645 [Planctomycetaceae bacterium]|nr:hypothetical protein [Planctomycetaceae bacterium]
MNSRFTLLRLPNALRCRFTAASGILKQLQYNRNGKHHNGEEGEKV